MKIETLEKILRGSSIAVTGAALGGTISYLITREPEPRYMAIACYTLAILILGTGICKDKMIRAKYEKEIDRIHEEISSLEEERLLSEEEIREISNQIKYNQNQRINLN